ncbi:MAG: hypothetical protein F6K52_05820 [Moorea sp. SIO3H5]|nr:hypothetical protein [Moorena sp. SIO3H5]
MTIGHATLRKRFGKASASALMRLAQRATLRDEAKLPLKAIALNGLKKPSL